MPRFLTRFMIRFWVYLRSFKQSAMPEPYENVPLTSALQVINTLPRGLIKHILIQRIPPWETVFFGVKRLSDLLELHSQYLEHISEQRTIPAFLVHGYTMSRTETKVRDFIEGRRLDDVVKLIEVQLIRADSMIASSEDAVQYHYRCRLKPLHQDLLFLLSTIRVLSERGECYE